MGAPRKEFDWNLLDSLCGANAAQDYVAERMIEKDRVTDPTIEVNKRTIASKMKFIERRIGERFGITYVEYRTKKLEGKRLKIFQKQFDVAMQGSVAMLIWLGKQYLGQTDVEKSEVKSLKDSITSIHEEINVLRLVKGGKIAN